MKKRCTYFLLATIFLIGPAYSVFCMEKQIIEKAENDQQPFCWQNFQAEFSVPGFIEKAFNNDGSKPEAYFPAELKREIAKKLCPLAKFFELGSYKEYPMHLSLQPLYQGQTWAPGIPVKLMYIGHERPETIEAIPGLESTHQVQFWLASKEHVRFDDDKAGLENNFYLGAYITKEAMKFDGKNLEGYGIFCYTSHFGDTYINLIHIDPVFNKKYVDNGRVLSCAILDQVNCDALALGHNACVLSITDKRFLATNEQQRYVQTYTIVKGEKKVSLQPDKRIAIPKKFDCSFKKIAYLTSQTLIGLTPDGKVFIIVPSNWGQMVNGKPKQVFFPKRIKYRIEDFAVHADYKKQLVLRTANNDIFFVDLSFLRIGLPCFCKKIEGKDLYRDLEKLPLLVTLFPDGRNTSKRVFTITNMWLEKDVFSYMYKTRDHKDWIQYKIN